MAGTDAGGLKRAASAGAVALARGVALPAHAARCPAQSLPAWSRWGASAALLTALLWLSGTVPVEAAFGYVRNLRVPPGQVTGGPHADFPVLVQFTGDPLLRTAPAGRISSPQAYDIQFRAADQVTILDHEVEFYDGGTGTLVAWVRLPVLQNVTNNDFSMFYGDPSVTCARNNSGRVWNPGYRYVYHLGESAGNPVDSTSNAVAATINPSLDPLATVARGAVGRIGRALEFLTPPTAIGTLDIPDAARPTQLQVADGTLAANTPFTLEAWVLFNDLGPNNTFYGLVAKGRESNADWIGLYKIPVGGNARFGLGWNGGNVNGTAPNIVVGAWNHAIVTFNGSNVREVWVNGALQTTSNAAATYAAIALATRVGDDSNGRYLNGRIDELRFSNVFRSAAWIQTNFNNQNAPGMFVTTLGESAPPGARFLDATASAGLGTAGVKDGGLAWGDFNGDGCLDVLVNTADGTTRSRLYAQARGSNACTGTFTDMTTCLAGGLLANTLERGAIWADVDNDGDLDFARNSGSPTSRIEVYRNNGAGVTNDPSCPAGSFPWNRFGLALSGSPSWTITDGNSPGNVVSTGLVAEGVGWIDYDQDGDVDLVSNSNDATKVFQNDGTGALTEVFPVGLPGLGSGTLGDYVAVGDVDADGDVDVFDRKDTQVDLYVNNGNGTFSAPDPAVAPFQGFDVAASDANRGGVALCDFDNDGDFDVAWTDAPQTQVWLQTGLNSRIFSATGLPAGLGGEDIDGVACPDIDNDGYVDLVLSGSNHFIFRNSGAGTFTDVTPAGFGGTAIGAGIVAGDYDRDGDLDVLVNQGGGGVAAGNELWRNETNDRNYLVVRALTDGRDAVGATASLYSCSGVRVSGIREVNGGEGHGTQGPLAMHFGLPTSGSPRGPGQIYEVRVQFVGGTVVRRALRPALQGCYQEVTIRSTDANDTAACSATAVRLLSLTATGSDGAVDLAWRTGSEVDNLGFHVHRSLSANGPWTRMTSSLVPGQGFSAMGASYSWRDAGLQNGVRYYYRLEDVDAKSGSTFNGPVSAVPQASATPPSAGADDPGSCESCRTPASPSCPAWALAQLGTSSAGSYACETHGDPFATSFEVLSRSAQSAVVVLRTEGFLTARDASGRVRALVPGFETLTDPRAPALPLKRALLEGIVARRARIRSVDAGDLQAFPDLIPAAVGYSQAVVSADGTVRPGRREAVLRAVGRSLVPREAAELTRESFQGERKTLTLELVPLRYDVSRGGLVLARRLVVGIDFTEQDAREKGRGGFGRRTPRTRPEAQAYAFLGTTRKGLHAVSFESLFPGRSQGLDVASLRLSRGGVLVPFNVEPRGSVFGPSSRLFFHADAVPGSVSFSPEMVYALERGAGGARMGLVAATPDGSAPAASRGLGEWETNRLFAPDILEIEDLWQWESMLGNTGKTNSFTLAGLDPSASDRARLVVHLQGGSDAESVVDHHVQVSVNGVVVADGSFDGAVPHRVDADVAASLLRADTNDLTVWNVGDTGVSSRVFLDRFEMAYPQTGTARAGSFEGVFASAGTAEVSGLASPAAVVDVTSGSWLTGYEAGASLRFRAEEGHLYLAVSEEALLAPRVFFPEAGSRLRNARNQADYVLVAPRAFLAAAQPLLAQRQAQGLTTFAAALEEIASAFGGGQPSAEAVRDFLSFAWHRWQRPSPRYVLLLGDANHDPRHYNASSQPSPMPYLLQKTSYIWTASDPALAAVNGDDLLPDLAIGRLPATTVEQAQAMITKILDWEGQGYALDGKVALVADNSDLAGDFEANVRDIEASFLTGRETTSILLGQLPNRDTARTQILDAFNQGLSLISYVGHGGGAVWAGENILNSWDTASLLAQPRQPLMLTMNCLNGYFITPYYESLAEAFLKAEGRGTIAAFSPSGLSLDGPAHLYHRAVVAEVTSGRHARLGDAILAAQEIYSASGAMPELLSVYHIFGDPATKVRQTP
jgi:hypothetical protein